MADPRDIVPSGCGWCGVPERDHYRRWGNGVGFHTYSPPTTGEIKLRMLLRRAARKDNHRG